MTYECYAIDWDCDGADPEELGLPESEAVEVDKEDSRRCDLDELLSDILSDRYGFCVNCFLFRRIK